MVTLTTYNKKDEWIGRNVIKVSHGVDVATLKNVILPCVPVQEIGCWNEKMGEWILKE